MYTTLLNLGTETVIRTITLLKCTLPILWLGNLYSRFPSSEHLNDFPSSE